MDCMDGLKQLDDNCIDMCVTSPPYWGLRDYKGPSIIWDAIPGCDHEWVSYTKVWHGDRGESERKEVFDDTFQSEGTLSDFCTKCGAWKGQLGLEPTFELYVKHLI